MNSKTNGPGFVATVQIIALFTLPIWLTPILYGASILAGYKPPTTEEVRPYK
jgi:hypothetical protein